MRYLTITLLLITGMILGSCNDESQMDIDQRNIEDYIAERGLDAESTAEGLYYVIEEPGGEDKPDLLSQVSVTYTGRLLDDSIFDSSGSSPVTFPLNGVIEGWQIGIPLFGRGGKGMLIIPSHLGYGSRGVGTIPPNSVLVFDVELVNFN